MDSQQGALDGHGPGTGSTGLGGGVGSKRLYDDGSSSSVVSFATDSVSVTQNSVVSGSVANSVVGPDGRRSVKSVSIGCRQRVTVVCAECKRLKLKCDRRAPCGSCTKRDTIPRCIYSQAAAEKVDVQSLNIRLQAVEGKLNGVSLPSEQSGSSAGPSNSQNSSSSSNLTHSAVSGSSSQRRAFLAVGAHGASIAVNLEGFAGLWVDHLGLNRPPEGTHDVPVSLAELDLERLGVKTMRQTGGSGIDLRPSPSVPAAGFVDFIEEHAQYFRVPASLVTPDDFEDEDNEQVGVSPKLVHHALPSAEVRKEIYKHFEQNHLMSPTINFFVFKNRIEEMCQWAEIQLSKDAHAIGSERVSKNGARDEPHPTTVLGAVDLSSMSSATSTGGAFTPPTFTFFAAAAFCLALGARCWLIEQDVLNGDPSSKPGASDHVGSPGLSNAAAGSNPATGVYDPTMPPPPPPISSLDTGTSASPASPTSGHAPLLSEGQPLHIHPSLPVKLYRSAKFAISMATECGGYETFDIDFILARCLQVRYLLCSHHGLGECADLLRDLGIAQRKKFDKRKRKPQANGIEHRIGDERDAIMSDQSTEPTSGARRKGKEKASERGPALALAPEMAGVVGELVSNARMMGLNHDPEYTGGGKFSVYEIEIRRRLWWEVVVLDAFVAHCLGESPFINDNSATTEFPADVDEESFGPDSANRPAPNIESLHGNVEQLIQRSRIVDLSKRMRAKITAFWELHPEAPASATRDLLEMIKKEFGKWQDSLPDHLRMKDVPLVQRGAGPTSPRRHPTSPGERDSPAREESPHVIAMRCRYNIMARHAFLSLCMALVKGNKSGVTGDAKEKDDTSKNYFGPSIEGFDALVLLEPALFIVRAWTYLHSVYRNVHPALFMCYAFTKELFEAAVVLGHLAITHPLFAGPALAGLRLAGETMRDPSVLTSKVTLGANKNDTLPSEAVRIVDELIARGEAAAVNASLAFGGDLGTSVMGSLSSVKRKHEEVEAASSDLLYHFRFPFVGAGVVSAGPPAASSDPLSLPTNGTATTVRAGDTTSRNGASSSRSKHGAGTGTDATSDPRPAARHKASHPHLSVRNRKAKDTSRARANSTASQRSDVSHRMSHAPSTTSLHGGAAPSHSHATHGHGIPPSPPLLGPGSYPGPLPTTPGPGPPHYSSPPGTSGGSSSQPPQTSGSSEFSTGFHDSGNFPTTSPASYGPTFPSQSGPGPSLPVPSQVTFDSFHLDTSEQRRDGVSLGSGESTSFGIAETTGMDRPGPVGMHQNAGFDNIGGLPRPPPESPQDRPFSRNLIDPRPHTRESDERIRPPMHSLDHQQHAQPHPPLHPPQTYHAHSQVPPDWSGYQQWPSYF